MIHKDELEMHLNDIYSERLGAPHVFNASDCVIPIEAGVRRGTSGVLPVRILQVHFLGSDDCVAPAGAGVGDRRPDALVESLVMLLHLAP